jgi:hypothetical protein
MGTPFTKPADYPNGYATLAAAIAYDDYEFDVVDGSTLQTSNFYVRIDSEQIHVTSRSGNHLVCDVRGANGTTATSHDSNAGVWEDILQKHFVELHTAVNNIESGSTIPWGTPGELGAITPNTGKFTTVYTNTLSVASGTTATLYNSTTETVNAFGAATSITMGASTGTFTIKNPLLSLTKIKVQWGNIDGILLGADWNAATITDSTAKYARISMPHYSSSSQPNIQIFGASNDSGNTFIGFGGGASTLCAATFLYFRTAATNTTLQGTIRMTVAPDGTVQVNSGILDVGVSGTTRGLIRARYGAGSNTAGTLALYSKGGTPYYLYVTDSGVLRIHTAAPSSDSDGTVVGTQT